MPRKADDSRRQEARRLYALGVSTPVIAAQLRVNRRTVTAWVGDGVRRRGPQPRPDLRDEKIRELMDEELSYAEAGRRLGVPWTTVRNRWYAINGRTRPRGKAAPPR